MSWRPVLIVKILLRFVAHCVIAGVATARIIVRRQSPAAGVVRMHYAPMSATGAAILGAMITLSPGSTTIDIDPERREILLHLLDKRTATKTLAAIRRDFEKDLNKLFGEDT